MSLLVVGAAVTVLVRSGVARLSVDEQLSLNMLALVVWWVGAFIACFGSLAFRRALFPLCFLFWIVPIPVFLLNSIVKLLQAGSVASAHLLFSAIGLPVAEDGTLLTIPGLTVEVARECSSIRSSLMLVVTTMVLTQTLLRSAWKKTLVIAVAIPLSVAKNGLRIFVLAMLATRVNRNYLTGRLHHQGGIIYFLIALAAIFLFIGLARHSEQKLRARGHNGSLISPELVAEPQARNRAESECWQADTGRPRKPRPNDAQDQRTQLQPKTRYSPGRLHVPVCDVPSCGRSS